MRAIILSGGESEVDGMKKDNVFPSFLLFLNLFFFERGKLIFSYISFYYDYGYDCPVA